MNLHRARGKGESGRTGLLPPHRVTEAIKDAERKQETLERERREALQVRGPEVPPPQELPGRLGFHPRLRPTPAGRRSRMTCASALARSA